MRKLIAGLGAMTVAAMLTVSCDSSTRDADEKNALTPNGAPAGTSGMADTQPAEPGPSQPAEAPPAEDTAAAAAAIPREARRAYREVTIPAGTVLPVRLTTSIGSDTSRVEQRVDGALTRAVRIDGVEALKAGASVRGIVTNAERSGRVKGRANVSFRFDHIAARGTVYPISTRTVSREAPGTKKRDAATIGVPAAGGAIIGGIIGGGDAAAKGGAIGGAAGTAAVLSTRGEEVRLARGTTVSVRLARPLTVVVPVR